MIKFLESSDTYYLQYVSHNTWEIYKPFMQKFIMKEELGSEELDRTKHKPVEKKGSWTFELF